jgi:ABC-type transport system involved in cytochrome c biogenesis permease subunit
MPTSWPVFRTLIGIALGLYGAACLAYLVAAILSSAVPSRKAKAYWWCATGVFGAGFVVAAVAYVLWGIHAGHVPLADMLEVSLCLATLMFPISLLCRRVLRIGGEGWDACLGAALLVSVIVRSQADPRPLMPALQSILFIPHVAAYMISYVILAKACAPAVMRLFVERSKDGYLVPYEKGTYTLVLLGFPLLTLGLVLGAVWGKLAWGDYWNWDPKELASLVSWLVYLGYLHFRYMYGQRFARVNSLCVIAGLVAIVITLYCVSLLSIFKGGMHSYAS